MNFSIVEGKYVDVDDIREDFIADYVFSTELSNPEIRRKYGLTHSEFKELSESVKKEFGLSRRPIVFKNARYYYPLHGGFVIQKSRVYFGFVPSEWVAKKVVELCKNLQWDVAKCKHICKNWWDYVS